MDTAMPTVWAYLVTLALVASGSITFAGAFPIALVVGFHRSLTAASANRSGKYRPYTGKLWHGLLGSAIGWGVFAQVWMMVQGGRLPVLLLTLALTWDIIQAFRPRLNSAATMLNLAEIGVLTFLLVLEFASALIWDHGIQWT